MLPLGRMTSSAIITLILHPRHKHPSPLQARTLFAFIARLAPLALTSCIAILADEFPGPEDIFLGLLAGA